jgi:hypothetical protein
LDKYAHDGEFPVEWDEAVLKTQHYYAKGLDVVAKKVWKQTNGSVDPIADARTFIRHDGDKIAREIMRIYFA